MTDIVDFTVYGVPVGKGRPRARRHGANIRLFTPAKTAAYEDTVAWEGKAAMRGRQPFAGPVAMKLQILAPVPASWTLKKIALALEGNLRPVNKPDMDNVIKAVFDALNGILYGDDKQVCQLEVVKRYSDTPCVRVVAWDMT